MHNKSVLARVHTQYDINKSSEIRLIFFCISCAIDSDDVQVQICVLIDVLYHGSASSWASSTKGPKGQ